MIHAYMMNYFSIHRQNENAKRKRNETEKSCYEVYNVSRFNTYIPRLKVQYIQCV